MKRNTLVTLAALALVVACGEGNPTSPGATAGPEVLGPSFDLVGNQVDASLDAVAEIMPLTVGGANGTTQLYIVVESGDGKNGCNLTGSTTLTVSVGSSNTAVATVSPSSITFGSCGDVKTLTVTPVAPGSATISLTQTSNTTGGTFTLSHATFIVNAALPPNTAPTIAVAGVTGGASYDKGSVPAATCQVADAEDGNSSFPATLSAVTGPYASDGIGSRTASCSYTDGGGLTASGSETYSIVDPSAPTLDYTLDPAAANGDNGWYTSSVALTWNVGDPQSPNSVVKSGCEDQNITVDQAGTTYTCSATSAGGSTNEVSVTVKRDATAPLISGSRSPAANGNGWNNADVMVSFECSDATSDVASCSGPTTLSSEGTNQSVTGNATDNAGHTASSTVSGISIDKTAPTISGAATAAANTAGWYKGDVTVHFTCSDDRSGIDASGCPADITVGSEGENQSAAGSVTDKADNTASYTVSGISIDKTAPTASAGKLPAANAFGWNNGTVTVSFTGSDALSGIANCSADETLSNEGANQSASGTCTDKAGNTSDPATATVHIDKTAPTINGSRSPDANGAGWNNADVAVSFGCDDNLSGVASCGPDQTVSAEGADQSVEGNAADYAGHTASATVSGISIDKTAPTISGSRTPAANGAGWNNTDVAVSFTCADGLSGLNATGCPADRTLSGEGASQSTSGTVTDNAGNSASATISGISIDKTAPTISGSPSLAANANGWNNADVTVSFACSDALSGIASCSGPSTLSEGANQSVAGDAADKAGNTASTTVNGINIDKTAPTVALVGGPAAGSSHYFGSVPAAPTCTGSDALSGLASCIVTGYSTVVGSHTVTATATDKAGNTNTATASYTVKAWTFGGFYQPVDMGNVYNTVKAGSTVPLKFEVFAGSELTDVSAIDYFKATAINCTSSLSDEIEVLSTGGTSLRYDTSGGQFIQNWQTPKQVGACYRITMFTDDGSSISALFKLK